MNEKKCFKDSDFQDYLDRNFTRDQELEFEEHLKSCKSCERKLEQYRVLFNGLNTIEAPELPADFTEMTMIYVKNKTRSAHRKRILNRALAGIIGLFIIVVIPVLLLFPGHGMKNFMTEAGLFYQYLMNIMNFVLILNSGLKGGELLNGLIWGGCATIFILFLKLKDHIRIIHHVL